MQLTVVIPTYNEAENIPKLVSTLFGLPIEDLKLLIVDDNSPDGTGEIAEQLKQTYSGCLDVIHRSGKLGLGTAYIQGFHQAIHQGADAVAQMDADFSHPPELLVNMYHILQTCDIAMGSRYVRGGSVDKNWPLWRKALSAFGNFYARTILRLPYRDVTGGYRMWRREALLGMPWDRVRSNGYSFQIEIAYLAYQLGYIAQEVPFYFADRFAGYSKMSLQIQKEAAIRVWQILYEYRNLQRV